MTAETSQKSASQNPLRAEKLDEHQAALLGSLADMYRKADDRTAVSQLLIPEFRAALQKVIGDKAERVLEPGEIDELCKAVDGIFKTHAELLDVRGLFKPVIAAMVSVRQKVRAELMEDFYAYCRELLAAHGITDRKTLLEKGLLFYNTATFSPYGKWRAFFTRILQEKLPHPSSLSVHYLQRVADRLGFKKESPDEKRIAYVAALRKNKITDRYVLRVRGPSWFRDQSFGIFGRGNGFASEVLERTCRKISEADLEEIADLVGFPQLTDDDVRAHHLAILAQYGIMDRRTLMEYTIESLWKLDFWPHGRGKLFGFVSAVLKRSIKMITKTILEELADALGFPKIADELLIREYRDAFAAHGIRDREGLLAISPHKFSELKFGGYGSSRAFVSAVLKKTTGGRPTAGQIRRLADALGW